MGRLSERHQLSPGGLRRYRQWRDSPATTQDQAALVLNVLDHIAENGWPPTDNLGSFSAPRWLYFRPNENTQDWIIAPADDLWIIVRQNEDDTIDFVNAYQPDEDQKPVPWLTEPTPDD